MALAQSFARCETNRASVKVQGCTTAVTQSRCKDAATTNDRVSRTRHLSVISNGHSPAFWYGGTNTHRAGKARMPYKMNAQSFARAQSPQSVHKRARMRDSGHTSNPLNEWGHIFIYQQRAREPSPFNIPRTPSRTDPFHCSAPDHRPEYSFYRCSADIGKNFADLGF